jgi:hypothetical protein
VICSSNSATKHKLPAFLRLRILSIKASPNLESAPEDFTIYLIETMRFLTTSLSLLSTLLCGRVLANFHVDLISINGGQSTGAVACPSSDWTCGCFTASDGQTGTIFNGVPGQSDFSIASGFCGVGQMDFWVAGSDYNVYFNGDSNQIGQCYPNPETMPCQGINSAGDPYVIAVTTGWVCTGAC